MAERGISLLCVCSAELTLDPAAGEAVCPTCGERREWRGRVLFDGSAGREEDYRQGAFSQVEEVESRHFWFAGRRRVVLAALRRRLGGGRGRRLLDIGCGTGFVLAALAEEGFECVGVDMHATALERAQRRASALFVQGDANRVLFGGQFDVVTLLDTIEHLDDDVRALRTSAKALRNGGHLLVTVPAYPWLWSRVDEVSGHKRRYSRVSLDDSFRAAGLQLDEIRYFNVMPFPAQVLQRLTRSFRARRENDEEVLARALAVPPRPLNWLFARCLALEAACWGWPWPWGGSLLAIGRRRQDVA